MPLIQGKMKNSRKSQSQTTKSLYLDRLPANGKKRKNKLNSGEIRFKSGESSETTRIISKSALDSLLSQKGNKKLSKFPEQPLNDRHYGDLIPFTDEQDDTDIARELPLSIHDYDKTNIDDNQQKLDNNDEQDDLDDDENDNDNEDYDDPSANEEFIKAYKHGDDPNKILNNWTNRKKLNPSSSSTSTILNTNLPQQQTSSHSSAVIDIGDNKGGARIATGPSGSLGSGLLSRLPGPPRDVVAQIVKPRFVTLSWLEPVKNPEEVVSYTVFYKMNNSER